MALYGAETWMLWAADQKYVESFEMWCWRRTEKISWIDHVRNEEVLLRVNEQRNILREIGKRKANWIGHILRRNCLLKQVSEGKIKGEMDVTRRWGRRRKKLLDDLKDRRGYSHLKEEALDLSSDRLLNNNNNNLVGEVNWINWSKKWTEKTITKLQKMNLDHNIKNILKYVDLPKHGFRFMAAYNLKKILEMFTLSFYVVRSSSKVS